jgi:hypothetical protein
MREAIRQPVLVAEHALDVGTKGRRAQRETLAVVRQHGTSGEQRHSGDRKSRSPELH